MCNACGFYCCAYDGFSKCGCDDCPEPRCHDDDEWELEDEWGDELDRQDELEGRWVACRKCHRTWGPFGYAARDGRPVSHHTIEEDLKKGK